MKTECAGKDMPSKVMKVGGLVFRQLDIDGRSSIHADINDLHCQGIYAYEFSDGRWYVGKSVDVRRRHVQHLHEYRHTIDCLVPMRMYFAEVVGSASLLDRAESMAISTFRDAGFDLTNIMKTQEPGGSSSLVVDVGEGFGIAIPWERDRRPRSEPVPAQQIADRRVRKLMGMSYWPKLQKLLSRYVNETIPAPDKSASLLWVCTCLAGKRGTSRSISVISCGNVETLTILEEDGRLVGFVNMLDAPEEPYIHKGLFNSYLFGSQGERFALYGNHYGSSGDVWSAEFGSLDELARLLGSDATLECCYRLNAAMMRKGPTMYRRFHNADLCNVILAEQG